MATSSESFQQVKDILRKLDRSIDAARTRRLGHGPQPTTAPVTGTNGLTSTFHHDPASTTVGKAENGMNGSSQPRPTNRARPLIRND